MEQWERPCFSLKMLLASREATPRTKANLNGNVYMKLRLRRQQGRIRNARWELKWFFFPSFRSKSNYNSSDSVTYLLLHIIYAASKAKCIREYTK